MEEFVKGLLGKFTVGIRREGRRKTEDIIDGVANLVDTRCVRPGVGVEDQGSLIAVVGGDDGVKDASEVGGGGKPIAGTRGDGAVREGGQLDVVTERP